MNISQSNICSIVIDTTTYYAANEIANKVVKTPKVDLIQAGIYAGSDYVARNYWTDYNPMMGSFSSTLKQNSRIAAFNFLGDMLYNMAKGRSLESSVYSSLTKSAIGLGANELVDRLMAEA